MDFAVPDIEAIDARILALESCIEATRPVSADERLHVGVDLGTAYIVVVVLNAAKEPVACALEFAQVVRDGLVVDYIGATHIVRRLAGQLEERLGRRLTHAAIAVPPGTDVKDCATHRHVAAALLAFLCWKRAGWSRGPTRPRAART